MDKATRRSLTSLLVLLTLVISFGIVHKFSHKAYEKEFAPGDTLRCAISLGRFDDTTGGLISGYNYALLERFAENIEASIIIRNVRREELSIDSLKKGELDILVVPNDNTEYSENIMVSLPVDSLTRWILPEFNRKRLSQVDKWISAYHSSEEFQRYHDLFLKTYDPLMAAKAGRKRHILSPYDSLIKRYADTLGWDWRLLTAVVFQESRFSISAQSHKGAGGLMQMIPSTAKRYDISNTFDPEESIKGGVKHLDRLQRIFRRYADTTEDLRRFTLAGYNAGEGNILKCIHYADSLNMQVRTWEELETFMPLFNFKWEETLSYVSRIYSYYWAFSVLYLPEPGEDKKFSMPILQSEQDQPWQ